jgi:hypothetical protein
LVKEASEALLLQRPANNFSLQLPYCTRFSADRVMTVDASDSPLFSRGHAGDGFEHVYRIIPSTEFSADFPPDDRFLYQRGRQPMPQRFIRAYRSYWEIMNDPKSFYQSSS